jgi:hypothetical protein
MLRWRVRTLIALVALAALLVWGVMMGTRSFDYDRRAREYRAHERGWREIALRRRDPGQEEFQWECVRYFGQLSAKYRRATWRPWAPVAPDPHAPGFDEWLEQDRRARRAADPRSRELAPAQRP